MIVLRRRGTFTASNAAYGDFHAWAMYLSAVMMLRGRLVIIALLFVGGGLQAQTLGYRIASLIAESILNTCERRTVLIRIDTASRLTAFRRFDPAVAPANAYFEMRVLRDDSLIANTFGARREALESQVIVNKPDGISIGWIDADPAPFLRFHGDSCSIQLSHAMDSIDRLYGCCLLFEAPSVTLTRKPGYAAGDVIEGILTGKVGPWKNFFGEWYCIELRLQFIFTVPKRKE